MVNLKFLPLLGPMWYLPPDAIVKLTDFVNELPFQYLLDGMTVVAKELIEIQKKCKED